MVFAVSLLSVSNTALRGIYDVVVVVVRLLISRFIFFYGRGV